MVDPVERQIQEAMRDATNWGRQLEHATQPETVEILACTSVSDGMGGSTETWGVVASLQGRLQASTKEPASVNLGSGLEVRQLWEVVLPAGTTIAATARLRINGQSYAVVADDRERSYSTSVHVLCYEV